MRPNLKHHLHLTRSYWLRSSWVGTSASVSNLEVLISSMSAAARVGYGTRSQLHFMINWLLPVKVHLWSLLAASPSKSFNFRKPYSYFAKAYFCQTAPRVITCWESEPEQQLRGYCLLCGDYLGKTRGRRIRLSQVQHIQYNHDFGTLDPHFWSRLWWVCTTTLSQILGSQVSGTLVVPVLVVWLKIRARSAVARAVLPSPAQYTGK
jgi:hypothetical protein